MIKPMLLEEEAVSAKEERSAPTGRLKKSKRGSFRSPGTWPRLLTSLFLILFSIGLLGLSSLRHTVGASVAEAVGAFNWMVLVRGDSLQIDEVGRFLKQLPGAKEVSFVSPQESFAKLQADPLYFNDLSAFKAEDVPASWRVGWEADPLDFSLLEIWAEDVRRLPSVINVAYDPSAILTIKGLRSAWYKIRLTLASIVLVGVLFTVILLGRLLFFTPLSSAVFAKMWPTILLDQVLWTIGGLAVFRLVGPFEWPLWTGGLVIGLLHSLWNALEKHA
jgi:hypothetical protein